jgi:hypothetical protein
VTDVPCVVSGQYDRGTRPVIVLRSVVSLVWVAAAETWASVSWLAHTATCASEPAQ